jgi:hypothetical protein
MKMTVKLPWFFCPTNLNQAYKGELEDLPESWLDLSTVELKLNNV